MNADFLEFIAVVVAFLAVGSVGYMMWIVGRALARRLAHRIDPATNPPGRVAELEARVVDVEQLQQRVAELEERVDFTERLLAQQRDPALPKPRS